MKKYGDLKHFSNLVQFLIENGGGSQDINRLSVNRKLMVKGFTTFLTYML